MLYSVFTFHQFTIPLYIATFQQPPTHVSAIFWWDGSAGGVTS
jgi:hypothetical protein